MSGTDPVFFVKMLEGELPDTAGETVIFIDPIGMPVSPTSVAGVHRRHRHRAIRRAVHRTQVHNRFGFPRLINGNPSLDLIHH